MRLGCLAALLNSESMDKWQRAIFSGKPRMSQLAAPQTETATTNSACVSAGGEPLSKGLFAKCGQKDSTERHVVRLLSSGNVALQSGRFLTESDIENGINYFESFSFLDKM
jgi:hypothetical protein